MYIDLFLTPVPVSPLLSVFGFLACRATAMCAGDVFFLFSLGLNFAGVFLLSSAFEHYAASGNYLVNVVAHNGIYVCS